MDSTGVRAGQRSGSKYNPRTLVGNWVEEQAWARDDGGLQPALDPSDRHHPRFLKHPAHLTSHGYLTKASAKQHISADNMWTAPKTRRTRRKTFSDIRRNRQSEDVGQAIGYADSALPINQNQRVRRNPEAADRVQWKSDVLQGADENCEPNRQRNGASPTAARRAVMEVDRKVAELVFTRGLNIERVFKRMDHDGDGSVAYEEFQRGLRQAGCVLNNSETGRLFKLMDDGGCGRVTYDAFRFRVESALEAMGLAERAETNVFNETAGAHYDREALISLVKVVVANLSRFMDRLAARDYNNTHVVTFAGFREALRGCGGAAHEPEMKELFDRIAGSDSVAEHGTAGAPSVLLRQVRKALVDIHTALVGDVPDNVSVDAPEDGLTSVHLRNLVIRTAQKSNVSLNTLFRFANEAETGELNYDQFRRALHRLGVPLMEKPMSELFKRGDSRRLGRLTYADYARLFRIDDIDDELMGMQERRTEELDVAMKERAVSTPKKAKQFTVTSERAVLQAVNQRIELIKRVCAEDDINGSGVLSEEEFTRVMSECGVILSDVDMEWLLKRCDPDDTGTIDYVAFIESLQSESSAAPESARAPRSDGGDDDRIDVNGTDEGAVPGVNLGIGRRGRKNVEELKALLKEAQAKFRARYKHTDATNAFLVYDKSRNGTVSLGSLCKVLTHVGVFLSHTRRDLLVMRFDPRRSGKIDYEGFLETIRVSVPASDAARFENSKYNASHDDIKSQRIADNVLRRHLALLRERGKKAVFDAFRAVDRGRTGKITLEQFRRALHHAGVVIGMEDTDSLFDLVELGEDDRIEYADFINVMGNTSINRGERQALLVERKLVDSIRGLFASRGQALLRDLHDLSQGADSVDATISHGQLKRLLSNQGLPLGEDDFMQLLDVVDEDRRGYLYVDDLCQLFGEEAASELKSLGTESTPSAAPSFTDAPFAVQNDLDTCHHTYDIYPSRRHSLGPGSKIGGKPPSTPKSQAPSQLTTLLKHTSTPGPGDVRHMRRISSRTRVPENTTHNIFQHLGHEPTSSKPPRTPSMSGRRLSYGGWGHKSSAMASLLRGGEDTGPGSTETGNVEQATPVDKGPRITFQDEVTGQPNGEDSLYLEDSDEIVGTESEAAVRAPSAKPIAPGHAVEAEVNEYGVEIGEEVDERMLELLDKCGLSKYRAVFEREELDLDAVMECSDEDLESLGLPLGPRRKLLAAVAATCN